MRVDVVESLPVQVEPAVPAVDDAGMERALRSFLAAIESDDSMFTCEAPGAAFLGAGLCSGDFVLRFRGGNLRSNRRMHFSLVDKLVELLGADGSAESLAARICLLPDAGGMALQIRLEARGNSAGQAGLRWGLGVAHVQQALLFTSRYLRQQMAQSGD